MALCSLIDFFLQNNTFYSSPNDATKEEYKVISEKLDKVNLDDSINKSLDEETDTPHQVPAGVADFDKENWNDTYQVSNYAMDIFNYLKGREVSLMEKIYCYEQFIRLQMKAKFYVS